jgi:hypothetical protein
MKLRIPVIWINRKKEQLEGKAKPDAELKDFRSAVTQLKA